MNIKGIFKATLFSIILTAICLAGAAALTYFNVTDERNSSILFFSCIVISVFIGSLGAAKAAQSKLLLNAFAVSLLYIILIIILSVTINGGFSLTIRTLTLIGSVAGAGILGAIFGR